MTRTAASWRCYFEDARTPNNALAAQVGIAASTRLGRVRALRQAGVIRGYHADVDPAALGRPLQAMIAVRLRPGARHRIRAFTDRIRACPHAPQRLLPGRRG